jgi:hypothetical protein
MTPINCPACGAPTFVGVTEDGCPLRVDESPAPSGNLRRLRCTNGDYPVVRVFSAEESAGRTDLRWAHHRSCTAPVKPSSVEDIRAWQPKRASDDNPKENDRG